MDNMKKQGKKVPKTNQDITLLESMDSTTEEITEKKFRMYIIKTFCELKDKIREQTQSAKDHFDKGLHKQIQEAKDYFNETEVLEKKPKILQIKEAINKVKN